MIKQTIGTCSLCGGPVTECNKYTERYYNRCGSQICTCIGGCFKRRKINCKTIIKCQSCGATKKESYGPVVEMEKKTDVCMHLWPCIVCVRNARFNRLMKSSGI